MINKKQIPNILTYARIVAIPLFISAFTNGSTWLALIIFLAASITDFLDGHLARKWQLETKFGAMLDQISDKLLVCAALLCLLSNGAADLIPVVIITFREIFVSGLREFMGGQGIAMPVSKLGKWKTASQLTAIVLLLLPFVYAKHFGDLLLWLSALLSAITAIQYAKAIPRL